MSVLIDRLNYAILLLFFSASTFAILKGGSTLYDTTTYFYNILIIAVLVLSYWYSSHKNSPLLQFTIIQFYVFILPRFLVYAFKPDMVVFPGGIDFSLAEINQGLCPMTLSFALFFLGMASAIFYSKSQPSSEPDNTIQPSVIIYLFVIYACLVIFQNQIFSRPDVSFFSLGIDEKSQLHIIFKILTTVLSADVFLFIIIYLYLNSLKDPKVSKGWGGVFLLCAWLASAIFVIDASLLGSRGAGIRIVQFAVAIFLIMQTQNKRIFINAALLSVFVVFINLTFYGTAQINRILMSSEVSVKPDETDPSVRKNLSDKNITDIRNKESKNKSSPFSHLMNRLGILDYFLITQVRSPEVNCQNKYLTIEYAIKNTANFLAPGNPYEEARLNTSNAFGLCFGGITLDSMKHRTSEIWTWPGLSKLIYPKAYLLLVFLGGIFLAMGIPILKKIFTQQNHYLDLSLAFYIFLMPNLVLFTMGLDHTMNTSITFVLRLGIALLVLYSINKFENYRFAGKL